MYPSVIRRVRGNFAEQYIATVSENFNINLDGQNYVHFLCNIIQKCKNVWYNGITIAEW